MEEPSHDIKLVGMSKTCLHLTDLLFMILSLGFGNHVQKYRASVVLYSSKNYYVTKLRKLLVQLCCFGQGTYNATRKNKYLDLSSVQQAESHSIREGGSSTLSFKLFLAFLRMPGTPIFKMKMAYDQNVEQLKVLCRQLHKKAPFLLRERTTSLKNK